MKTCVIFVANNFNVYNQTLMKYMRTNIKTFNSHGLLVDFRVFGIHPSPSIARLPAMYISPGDLSKEHPIPDVISPDWVYGLNAIQSQLANMQAANLKDYEGRAKAWLTQDGSGGGGSDSMLDESASLQKDWSKYQQQSLTKASQRQAESGRQDNIDAPTSGPPTRVRDPRVIPSDDDAPIGEPMASSLDSGDRDKILMDKYMASRGNSLKGLNSNNFT
jgi:hypothetical protein